MDKDLIIPGRDIHLNMTLKAWHETAKFVLTNPMKPGDNFTIETTDGRKLIIHLK